MMRIKHSSQKTEVFFKGLFPCCFVFTRLCLAGGVLLVFKEPRKTQPARWSANPFLSTFLLLCATVFLGWFCQTQQRGNGKTWPAPKTVRDTLVKQQHHKQKHAEKSSFQTRSNIQSDSISLLSSFLFSFASSDIMTQFFNTMGHKHRTA